MRFSIANMVAAGLLFTLAQGGIVTAAEIKVLCTQALRTSILELAPRFERSTGHKVNVSVAPSGQLTKRVRDGEQADILIANAPNIDALIKEGKLTGARIELAQAHVGMSVKAGAAKPDISSPDAVKRALLAAKAVAYSKGGLSGNHFEKVLEKLGIAAEIKAKAKFGSPAAGFVVRGEADIAVQQISELIAVEGAELIGLFPGELDGATQFSLGILSSAKERGAADVFVKFLKSGEAAGVIEAKGLTPG